MAMIKEIKECELGDDERHFLYTIVCFSEGL